MDKYEKQREKALAEVVFWFTSGIILHKDAMREGSSVQKALPNLSEVPISDGDNEQLYDVWVSLH